MPLGIKGAFTRLGVVIALTFVGLPFVVRTLQPVLEGLEREVEEAAATLGAGRLRTFVSVIAPSLVPPILTGFALAFARAIGEYGSIVFISGNKPFKTEIAPYLIVDPVGRIRLRGRHCPGGGAAGFFVRAPGGDQLPRTMGQPVSNTDAHDHPAPQPNRHAALRNAAPKNRRFISWLLIARRPGVLPGFPAAAAGERLCAGPGQGLDLLLAGAGRTRIRWPPSA